MTGHPDPAGTPNLKPAGDVLVFDVGGALDGVAGEVVGVPDNAFGGDFRMLAQELQRVGRGGGVVFLIGELGGLDGGLVLFAEAAVEDGELVVGGEVVGIDGLQLLVGVARGGIVVLLVVARSRVRGGRRWSADIWRATAWRSAMASSIWPALRSTRAR